MESAKRGGLISASLLLLLSIMAVGCSSGGPAEAPLGAVERRVLLGPQCPVVRENEPCPDRPLSAPIEVRRARSEDAADASTGRVVRRLNSGRDGEFEILLPAGPYWFIGLSPGEAPLPRPPEPILVHLEPGGRVQITLNYDSGIR